MNNQTEEKGMKMNNKGFTLTEILIVLVVAGILLALILPNVLRAIERGNATAVRSDLNSIKVALFMCYTEKKDWGSCDAFDELSPSSGTKFLDAVPVNPFVATDGYGIKADPSGTGGKVPCLKEGTYPADITADMGKSINKC